MSSGRDTPGESNANEQRLFPTLSGREYQPCDRSAEVSRPNETFLPLPPFVPYRGAYPKSEFQSGNQNYEEYKRNAGDIRQGQRWGFSKRNADNTVKYQIFNTERMPIDRASAEGEEDNDTKAKRQTYAMGFKKLEEIANFSEDNTLLMLPLPALPDQVHNNRYRGAYPKPEFKSGNQNDEEYKRNAGDIRQEQRWGCSKRNADDTGKYQNINTERVAINRASAEGGENNDTKAKRQTYAMGFKKLEEIANFSEDNILLMLLKNSEPFSLLLDKTDLSPNCIYLILKTMKKLANSLFDQHKLKMLHMVTKDNFMRQLITFVAQLPLQDEHDKRRAQYFWKDPTSFFLDLYKLCEMILQVMPSKAINVLPKLLKAALCDIPHLNIGDDIRVLYEDLEAKILKALEDIKTRKSKEEEPPDNFRHISVFPEPFEIVTRNSPFLRENIVEGAYKSVEHYLDVQFRLVRNDFVKPLRDGICSYLEKDGKGKLENVKLYKGVMFVKAEVSSNGDSGYLIQLPQKKNRDFQQKLENSRLFMYGSLVCFTKNNFDDIIFGRIVDRKVELLKEGRLVVSLHSKLEKIDFDANYIMIESKIYFEPYYNVLLALKKFHENDFPMKEYIVDMQPNGDVPNYYLKNEMETENKHRLLRLSSMIDEDDQMNMKMLAQDEMQTKEKYRIPIIGGAIHEENWPTAETLELNDAQYAAYKNALSRKFAIIQGPPGTGKTHVGLKVAKALITNADAWHNEYSPMLVICFTNHALDQFLEGLITTTGAIVRIGGQSKNTKLEEFNIKNVRRRFRNYLTINYKDVVKETGEALQRSYNLLEALRLYNGIVNIKQFFEKTPEMEDTWFFHRNNNEFVKWLLGGNVHKNIKESDRLKIFPKYEEEEQLFHDIFMLFEKENKCDVDDNIFDSVDSSENVYLAKISDYEHSLHKMTERAECLSGLKEQADPKEWITLQSRYEETLLQYDYLKEALERGKSIVNPQPADHLFKRLHNPYSIPPDDRWLLYFYWLKEYETRLITMIPELEAKYRNVYQEYEEAKMVADVRLLRDALIVGMTTTSAARLQPILRSLRSPVVFVEEAAEIMEAHIVASLTKSCDHVILIGDHQQLRPSTADYLMETKYKLGISLFERMVRNKVHCNVLEVQHRMRPEISSLIVPTIYLVLHNHESVYNFPPVRGVHRNLYFIDHKNEEILEKDESKYNMHEVEYLIHLAQYLILNGYEAEDITILCAYSAQMFKMFHERKNYPMLHNVRICVLDNFQGEENKIILLSLVRNNNEGKIGFLKIDNRICVALSRAREGFYIMGNMDMLTHVSPIWQEIKKTLESHDGLGAALPLCCQLHKSKITLIKAVADFEKVAEGGCDKICNELLLCGHNCKIQCHIRNRDHSELNCREKCQRILCSNEHVCPKLCFENCGQCTFLMERHLQCGHTDFYPCFDKQPDCQEIVSTKLQCGHEVMKRCHINSSLIKCPQSCDTRIESCGHACELLCHIKDDPDHLEYKCEKKCERIRPKCTLNIDEHRCTKKCYEECGDCNVMVQKLRSCSHVYEMECSADIELKFCVKPCKKMLPCGHKCLQECSKPCGNCTVKVEKVVLDCRHKIHTLCKDVPTRYQCTGQCILTLPCGHQCQNRCKDPCTTNCQRMSRSIIPLACGHNADIPCSLNKEVVIWSNTSLLKYCKVPCKKTLKCKHTCSGTCGECYQGRIHKVCTSTCGARLLCGHLCDAPCRKVCPPCRQECEFGCPHGKYTKKCNEPHIFCKRTCTRQCQHRACPKRCGEICSIPPCEQPCPEKLKCGHNCIGYCGDPCPTLCRVCNYKEFIDESSTSYEDDSKFVLLKDCGHIIKDRRMSAWLRSNNHEIGVKCCPECQQTLVNTARYSDHMKTSWENIIDVMNKYRQPFEKTKRDGQTYVTKLNELRKTNLNLVCPSLTTLCDTFATQLKPAGRKNRQNLTKLTVEMTTAKVQILQNISKLYDGIYRKNEAPSRECVEYLEYLLGRLTTARERMTGQEIDDYAVELKRLRRILQLSHIASCRVPDVTVDKSYINIREKVYCIGPYNTEEDENIKRELEVLSGSADILDIGENELQDVVRVVGAKSGVWYKCAHGHICAVGDSGDTIGKYKCHECINCPTQFIINCPPQFIINCPPRFRFWERTTCSSF